MKSFLSIGLAIYIVYLPIFVLLLALAVKRCKDFSVFNHWISNLGESKSKSHLSFTVSQFVLGLLSPFFIISFFKIFPETFPVKIAIAFFSLTSFFLIAVALSPLDKRLEKHKHSTNLLFLGISGSVLSVAILRPFSVWFSAFTLVVIVGMALFIVPFVILRVKYGYAALASMSEIRQKEKSCIFKNIIFLEWLALSLYFIWLFLLVLYTFYSL